MAKAEHRVLISGASGFLGLAVMREFRRNHWESIPLVRSRAGFPNERLIDFEQISANQILQEVPRCDAVVHMATHVDFRSDLGLEPFISTNVLATVLLATIAKAWGAKLIFLSGTIVFGEHSHITTDLEPSPGNPYGYAKRVAEQIIEASDVSATILRSSGIFGYRGPSHLGINRVITAAIDEQLAPTLVGSGSAKRNYIFVDDLASIVVLCATTDLPGIHLVAGRDLCTIKEMLGLIGEVFVPGTDITQMPGGEEVDRTVESSKKLPAGRSFKDALESIKKACASSTA